MRYSIVALAPFVAAAYAQDTTASVEPVVVPVDVNGSTSLSTYTYSNPATQYLTQTNSLGVVTGQPTLSNGAVATVAETSQPALATIPAGLPTGINTVYIGGGNQTASSFLVSVGSSTTVVVGSTSTGTTGTGASPTGGNDDESSTGTSNEPSGTDSSSSETSSSAANANVLVSGAIFGLGALFAALL